MHKSYAELGCCPCTDCKHVAIDPQAGKPCTKGWPCTDTIECLDECLARLGCCPDFLNPFADQVCRRAE